MASPAPSLFQTAAVFAGGLAVGAGALALARPSFAPAKKITNNTRNKVQKARRASQPDLIEAGAIDGAGALVPNGHAVTGAEEKKKDEPASRVLDAVDAKGTGPVAPSEPEPTRPPLDDTSNKDGAKLNGLENKPASDPSGDVPEPSPINRAKDLDTRMDLSGPVPAHGSAVANDGAEPAPVWLAGLPSETITSSGAIETVTYGHSTAVFCYESNALGGFGQSCEAWAEEASQKGWTEDRPKVFSMQTRAGAGAAVAGYLAEKGATSAQLPTPAGKVVTALTNASGLLAMAPALSAIGSNNGRLVLQVSSASQPDEELNVTNNYAAALSAAASLGEGFTVLLSSDRQEAVDLAHVAYQTGSGNVVHVFDGAYAGREVAKLEVPAKTAAPSSSSIQLALLAKGYEHFSYAGAANPQTVLVLPNSAHSRSANAVLAALPEAIRQVVGILSVRVLRPWSDAELRKALPSSVRTIHVLEEARAVAGGVSGGVLYEDVMAATFSDEFSSAEAVKAVLPLSIPAGRRLTAAEWSELFTALSTSAHVKVPVSLESVLSHATDSAQPDLLEASGARLATFIDSDASATVHLPALVARTFRERGDGSVCARLLQRYDNFEAGGIARADLLLSEAGAATDVPLELVSEQNSAHVLVVSDPATTLKSYNVFASLRQGGTVLFNTPGWDAGELTAKLRAEDKKQLAAKNARLYLIDASAVVQKLSDESAVKIGGKAKVGTTVPKEVASAVLLVAFLRLYGGSSAPSLPGALASLVRRILGTAPLGVEGVDGLTFATERAVQLVTFGIQDWAASEPQSEAEANAAPRPRQIRYNGFAPAADAATVGLEPAAVRTTWALPAWQLMFREAYGLDTTSLRPDLPEQNYVVKVTENRRLTPVDYDRNVFHMEFSTAGTGLKYEVGEALGIHGWNDADEVREFISWSGYDADEIISVPSLVDPSRYESRTVFQILQQRLDIFGKPPKRFYEALSGLATNRDEARWLRFIASAEGSSTFKKLAEVETVTYGEVLRMFPSARLPLDRLMTEVEPIKPRHYSIASAQAAVGDSVHLLIVTVDWLTPSGSPRYGQCTRYLANLAVGAEVTVSIKPSVMKLPPLDTQPIIMAGLGTGAAPFRAFIQYRALQRAQGKKVGPLVYYFGSRYRRAEYLYGEELEAYTADGVISHMGLAFSRDTRQKVYIQHKIQEDGEMLSKYLAPEIEAAGVDASVRTGDSLESVLTDVEKDKGYFYLCGPTWPVPDVYEALIKALGLKGLSEQQAADKIEQLKEEERYVLEVY